MFIPRFRPTFVVDLSFSRSDSLICCTVESPTESSPPPGPRNSPPPQQLCTHSSSWGYHSFQLSVRLQTRLFLPADISNQSKASREPMSIRLVLRSGWFLPSPLFHQDGRILPRGREPPCFSAITNLQNGLNHDRPRRSLARIFCPHSFFHQFWYGQRLLAWFNTLSSGISALSGSG